MKSKTPILRACGALALSAWLPYAGGADLAASDLTAPRPPVIAPDYAGIVIPPNIAPLNFAVKEPGRNFRLEIQAPSGKAIAVGSRDGSFRIPAGAWRKLLEANRGREIWLTLSAESLEGDRVSFQSITNRVALENMDRFLAYRRLHPQYTMFGSGTIGIYQRDLESFEETPILHLTDRTGGNGHCVNCHTFLNRDPQTFTLHLRGGDGKAMLLVRGGKVSKVDLTAGYMSWHPSGQFITFSRNKLALFFHSLGETRDVYDEHSDLGLYWVEANRLEAPKVIAEPEFQENWPMWSQDGKHLYFCRTRGMPLEDFKKIRYDLARVSYDAESDTWGSVEILLTAEQTGRSLLEPRPSPDGRFLLFTAADYGHFPIYQKNSENYIMDLDSREYRPLEVNSGHGETWHCWSSNGRWIVFSSKRLNRFLTRPFFSYVDAQGKAAKPFVLPQEDPAFYDYFVKTFNVPEFVQGAVTVQRDLFQGALEPPTAKPEGVAPGKEQTDEAGPARK